MSAVVIKKIKFLCNAWGIDFDVAMHALQCHAFMGEKDHRFMHYCKERDADIEIIGEENFWLLVCVAFE